MKKFVDFLIIVMLLMNVFILFYEADNANSLLYTFVWKFEKKLGGFTWKRRMSRGFPAFFRQFWLHLRKNLRKNLENTIKRLMRREFGIEFEVKMSVFFSIDNDLLHMHS